jgi:hypothetical protein
MTPAMKAKVTDRLWDIEDILNLQNKMSCQKWTQIGYK